MAERFNPTASERRELWESLSVVEDWLAGGVHRRRDSLDFEAAEVRSEARAALAAPRAGDSLDTIAEEVRACRACRLCEKRKLAVPGQGPSSPLAMVVGEAPGAEEDMSGLPFVGPAGKLLDKMLDSIGLSRQGNCFIANVVKCRPPQNRDPAADEQDACLGYLRRQIALLRPRAILCVGRIASGALLGTADGVGKLRGSWRDFEGMPLLVTYHPSALLRDDSYKRPAWEDLKKFRERVLPAAGAVEVSSGSDPAAAPGDAAGSAPADSPGAASAE
jgi:uracil-DNA glycosylase